MNILITESPSENGYIESLIQAYSKAGHTVICDAYNFYFSNFKPDILHIHWPERLYKWCPLQNVGPIDIYSVIQERLLWYKNNGTKIVHTIHNLKPHEHENPFEEKIYRLVMTYADVLVHHCAKSIDWVIAEYPDASNKINIICPHGDYLIHYKNINQSDARQQLGISQEKTVILNFGRQRPYKNENFIGEVFTKLNLPAKHLLIAGQFANPGSNFASRLYFHARNKIRTRFKHSQHKYIYQSIPTTDLPAILSSADIVFVGQRQGLNSGLLALAATYSKAVVCPEIGCFSESLSGWQHNTYEAGNIPDATRALLEICHQVEAIKQTDQELDNSQWLAEHSWDKHAATIVGTVKQISR